MSLNVEIYRHSKASPFTYSMLDRRQVELRELLLRSTRGPEEGSSEASRTTDPTLLFAEVSPVITLGYRNTDEDLLLDRSAYANLGIEILRVQRGGRATYHGPGQWVVFVIGRLGTLTGDPRGVRKFVSLLFEATLKTVRERFPEAEIREGAEAGVWSAPGPRGGKVAALGVRIDQGITQHGLCLNVYPTSDAFTGIRPCGIDAQVAYLEDVERAEQTEEQSVEEKMERWRRKFTDSLHASLAEQLGIPHPTQ